MSAGLGKYAAPQVEAHLREDPDRGGLVVQVHFEHSNSAGALYERHVLGIDAALGYIGTFWRNSAPGRDAAEPPATGVEWGYRYRLLELRPGHSGRSREATADSREDAEEQVAALLADDGKWEAEVIWRTAAVEPGPWHSRQRSGTDAPYKAGAAREDGEEVSPQALSDLLSLVYEVAIPPGVIATWTPGERAAAEQWSAAEHLSASDNEDVAREHQPEVVRRAGEICASPVLAQLAVESWRDAGTRFEQGGFDGADEALHALMVAAQDAITGLLVLLGGDPVAQMQASYNAGYVKAREHALVEEDRPS